MPGFKLLRSGTPTVTLLVLLLLAGCDSGPTGPQVASVGVSAASLEVEIDGTLQLSATARDGSGNALQGVEFEWVSSDESRAEVSDAGLVTGRGLGQVTIEARVSGVAGSITLEVVGPAPQILSISPATLREGEDAFLVGEGFSEVPEQNRVRIGGRLATVLEASETELVVRVPTPVCYPAGNVPVTASLGGSQSEPRLHLFDPPPGEAMAVGEFRRLAAPDARCLRLPGASGSERYVFGAQSTSRMPLSTVRVMVEGRRGGGAVASTTEDSHAARHDVASTTRPGPRIGASERMASTMSAPDRWSDHRAVKPELRRAEARSLAPVLAGGVAAARDRERLHRPDIAAADAAPLASAVPASVQQGDTVNLSVPDISSDNFCQTGRDIRAVVKRVGAGSIWVEDVANPDGFTDRQYEELSDLFDHEILDELTRNFGEPSDLDDNDRIVIVISEAVNRMSEFALGFVVTVDFFPDQCPAGNGGEYYYARAPDPSGSIPGPDGPPDGPYTVADALEDAPVLLAHETTHIIQFGRRLAVPNVEELPEIWELEGQATLAEELAGFRVRGLGPNMNLGFSTAFTPSSSSERDWFSSGFIDLAIYYGFESQTSRVTEAPHECGWLSRDADGPCDYSRLPYGVPWSFLRWISDHLGPDYSGGAAQIQRNMIDHPRSGFETLEDVLGRPVEPLLARWAATLYTDGRLPSGSDPQLSFPSWDLRSIDQGLVVPARLQPTTRSFSTFTDERRLAAGSSAYFLLEGGSRPDYALEIRPHTGTTLPETVQLWVVRIQ